MCIAEINMCYALLSKDVLLCYQVLWDTSGSNIVYPCHAVLVAMQVSNGHQRFFIGHTDKVRNIAFFIYFVALYILRTDR